MKKIRCPWGEHESMREYHDTEWGVPVYNDKKIFEFLILEGAQAGLSWSTILKRREGYRNAYKNFDPKKIAKFTDRDIKRLLNDSGIIRNRLKVAASISNAKCFLEVQKEFGTFSKYIWGFVDGKPIDNRLKKQSDIPATSDISDKLSKDLKKRGFKFVGSTIIYAHMQATGMVNDHVTTCFRHKEV